MLHPCSISCVERSWSRRALSTFTAVPWFFSQFRVCDSIWVLAWFWRAAATCLLVFCEDTDRSHCRANAGQRAAPHQLLILAPPSPKGQGAKTENREANNRCSTSAIIQARAALCLWRLGGYMLHALKSHTAITPASMPAIMHTPSRYKATYNVLDSYRSRAIMRVQSSRLRSACARACGAHAVSHHARTE